jgi:hypothetical protein
MKSLPPDIALTLYVLCALALLLLMYFLMTTHATP